MNEIRDKTIEFAQKIKAVDPSALVVGPEEWGWSGYFYSGYDQQWGSQNGWGSLPDRNNHGGADYLPWFLDQMRQRQTATGQRLLDVFTVHYYPQGGEFSDDVSTAMQQRRNRSTRSLWDPNYVDETWINDRVQLIPRLKSWVNANYPGTQIGITEYNWGAENHINGATTQADVYGIFGREGLNMGARWATPAASTPTYKAMKLYRNYDGNKSTFGDTSVAAAVPNPDTVSAFAAQRASDGALTVMVISKYLVIDDAGDDYARERHSPRDRAGVAVDLSKRDYAPRRCHTQRQQPCDDAASSEHYLVRGSNQRLSDAARRADEREDCERRAVTSALSQTSHANGAPCPKALGAECAELAADALRALTVEDLSAARPMHRCAADSTAVHE